MLRLSEVRNFFHEIARVLDRRESELEQEGSFLGVLLPPHESISVATHTADSSAARAACITHLSASRRAVPPHD